MAETDDSRKEFKKVISDLVSDILTTFPELKDRINQDLLANDDEALDRVHEHCKKVFPERFFDILYQNEDIFKNENVPTRTEVMENLIPYIQEQTLKGVQLNHIMRHTVGLFHGQNGSKTWKQYLSKNMCIRDADLQKVNHIMDQVRKTNPVSLER